ncbi:hypothetical protein MRV_0127 [Murine roseolovirus]|uniref:Uncharacterized protein n=1 Tax=Murid betaherpesvirus 3 TaxID=2560603 RepID=A0A1P8VJ23_9BETA|nr:hypothetical protein MRV_0127 [Murine roseolovirus]APZ76338.1 hypothetical protein MRV_0127 [Murid betaherpesvirus 3]
MSPDPRVPPLSPLLLSSAGRQDRALSKDTAPKGVGVLGPLPVGILSPSSPPSRGTSSSPAPSSMPAAARPASALAASSPPPRDWPSEAPPRSPVLLVSGGGAPGEWSRAGLFGRRSDEGALPGIPAPSPGTVPGPASSVSCVEGSGRRLSGASSKTSSSGGACLLRGTGLLAGGRSFHRLRGGVMRVAPGGIAMWRSPGARFPPAWPAAAASDTCFLEGRGGQSPPDGWQTGGTTGDAATGGTAPRARIRGDGWPGAPGGPSPPTRQSGRPSPSAGSMPSWRFRPGAACRAPGWPAPPASTASRAGRGPSPSPTCGRARGCGCAPRPRTRT